MSIIYFSSGVLNENAKDVLYMTLLSVPTATILALILIGSPAMIGLMENGESFWLMVTFSLRKVIVLSFTCFLTAISFSFIGYFVSGYFEQDKE